MNVELTLERTTRLVSDARDGDREAVEILFERYLPRVRRMVSLRLGRRLADLGAEEDLVQETLLEAFRSIERFEHRSVGSFRSWLAQLAVNRIRDAARHLDARKRGEGRERPFAAYDSRVLTESVFAGRQSGPEEVASEREFADRIEAALLVLSERDRRVIELRRIAELSFEEIANELELGSAASARAQFARSLRRLSAELGE